MQDVKPADFRNKKREYLSNKINELAKNSKIRDLYRGIYKFKGGYQPRNNLVEYENGDLLADSNNILNRWNIRQIEVHTAEQLVIQAGGQILLHITHTLNNSVWNKEELPDQLKESIIVPVHKKGDKTEFNNYCGISLLSTSYKILSNILLSRLGLYIDETTVDHQCGF
jgi:hypothetical protein